MRSGGNYSRLGVDDQEIESIELSQSVENPLRRGEEFTIRVLFKEKTHEIHHLTPNSTITQLKNASTAVTDVPFLRQRLIFAGRPLRPDDATLSSLGLCHNAAVHLFPIPETLPVTSSSVPMETATTVSSSASTTGLVHGIASYGPLPNGIGAIPMRSVRRNNGDGSIYDTDSHRIVHPDPTVVQTATKARIWSVVLLSLSAFALVSDLSYVLSLGTFGDNLLSSIVVILDITSSIGGIAVGFQGMKAVRTMNLQETKTYVGGLAFVGILSLVMRCLWVFDMIHAAKRAVRESEDNAQAHEDAGEATDDEVTGSVSGMGNK